MTTLTVDFLATNFSQGSPLPTISGSFTLVYDLFNPSSYYSLASFSSPDFAFNYLDCPLLSEPYMGGTFLVLGGPPADGPSWIGSTEADMMLVFTINSQSSLLPYLYYSLTSGGQWSSYNLTMSITQQDPFLSSSSNPSLVPIPSSLYLLLSAVLLLKTFFPTTKGE